MRVEEIGRKLVRSPTCPAASKPRSGATRQTACEQNCVLREWLDHVAAHSRPEVRFRNWPRNSEISSESESGDTATSRLQVHPVRGIETYSVVPF
jgi:hypothetical protein